MYQVIIAEDEFFVRLGIKNSVSWEKYNMPPEQYHTDRLPGTQ